MTGTGSPPDAQATRLDLAYEQLRARALVPCGQTSHPVGYGLVVHRGLVTWMRTTRAPEVPPAVRTPATRQPAHSELVHTIVSLIVGHLPSTR